MRESTEQILNEHEQKIDQLEKNIRIGTVLSVDMERKTVRVSWSNGTQSTDIRVLENGINWMPSVGEKILTIHRTTGDGWVIGSLTQHGG